MYVSRIYIHTEQLAANADLKKTGAQRKLLAVVRDVDLFGPDARWRADEEKTGTVRRQVPRDKAKDSGGRGRGDDAADDEDWGKDG